MLFWIAADVPHGLEIDFHDLRTSAENSVELHLFEVFASMELGTGEFNTFRTH